MNMQYKTIRAALAAVRKQYHDSIVQSIVNEPHKTYLTIAREHGVSEPFVIGVAKQYGVGRKPLADDEVTHDH